jgi:gamma-carbonic anhydrase
MDLEAQFDRHLAKTPVLGTGTWIAPGAVVVGDVTLGDHSSVWFNAVLRADLNRIIIGHHTNIQDTCVLHLSDEFPCIIGNYVTVGHGAIVHACTVADGALIGMRATVLDGAVIGAEAIIGANSLVPMGMEIPAGHMAFGNPAKVVRKVTPEERVMIRGFAEKYVRAAQYYRESAIQMAASET